ncbi:MAG: hypothetical protein ACKPCM_13045, partial [Pseudanabaena sp.]
ADVRYVYNLDSEVIMTLSPDQQASLLTHVHFFISQLMDLGQDALDDIARKALEEISKQAVKQGGKQLATDTTKNILKWIPVVGQLISMVTSGTIALAVGSDYIDKCHQAARDVMMHELKEKNRSNDS